MQDSRCWLSLCGRHILPGPCGKLPGQLGLSPIPGTNAGGVACSREQSCRAHPNCEHLGTLRPRWLSGREGVSSRRFRVNRRVARRWAGELSRLRASVRPTLARGAEANSFRRPGLAVGWIAVSSALGAAISGHPSRPRAAQGTRLGNHQRVCRGKPLHFVPATRNPPPIERTRVAGPWSALRAGFPTPFIGGCARPGRGWTAGHP
jgi:hypothetical protein